MRSIIHFAHGNGFPSPCYMQVLRQLESAFDCCYIDRIGHAPEFPVTENWEYLVDEVIESIVRQASQPVIAVGHSLGGVLSLLAAIKQPALFKGVILLDSPVMSRLKSNILRFSKLVGLIDKVTPAAQMRNRRQHWHNKDAVLSWLTRKKLFKHFTDACLHDYIEHGLELTDEGYALRFDRGIEYHIYRTIPHQLHLSEGKLQVATALIYGEASTVVNRADLQYMKKYYGITSIAIEGTHMFPMEHPTATAQQIMAIAHHMTQGQGDRTCWMP